MADSDPYAKTDNSPAAPDTPSGNKWLWATDSTGQVMYHWYGVGDPRNQIPGVPSLVYVDGESMRWEDFAKAYPDRATSQDNGQTQGDGKIGKPGDAEIPRYPGMDKDPLGLPAKLRKELNQAKDQQQNYPYAPFGWLEPTRRQGEEQYLQSAADMYFQMWGTPPPPNYLEGQISKGLNFYEMFDEERKKPAFRHTKFYRDQYGQQASTVASVLGMVP